MPLIINIIPVNTATRVKLKDGLRKNNKPIITYTKASIISAIVIILNIPFTSPNNLLNILSPNIIILTFSFLIKEIMFIRKKER